VVNLAGPLDLLGGHVLRRAHYLFTGLREARSPPAPSLRCIAPTDYRHTGGGIQPHQFGQAKVGDLYLSRAVEQDVFGLDVAMDDAAVVCVLEGIADLRNDGQGFLRLDTAAIQQLSQREATRDGGRVVPTLVQLLKFRGRNVYYVLPLLASMGPTAHDALPTLRELAELKGWSVLSAEAKATIAAIEQTPDRPGEEAYVAWWNDLAGGDADRSVSAVWAFALGGQEAAAFLAKRSRQAQDKSASERVKQLVKELDGDQYRVREQASAKLMAMLPEAEPDLREALKATKSLEVNMRLEALLRDSPDHGLRLTVDATAADIRRAFRVRQVRELTVWRASTTQPATTATVGKKQ
jgi:hypothetical protein